MWAICIFIAIIVGVQAHEPGSSDIHAQCLKKLNLTMDEVLPYVHKITDPSDKEGVGELLACVFQGRKIIDKCCRVSSRKIAYYIIDLYSSLNLTRRQKLRIKNESYQCKKLKAKHISTLAVKVKNCILITVDNLGFLPLPNVSTVTTTSTSPSTVV